ncbi:MAG: uroporphyrinogen-III C-methyltransferase [Burkholderiales bacterium]|nr:uroporphyrinogen-III C-methyltransferase [Burkholderiales bacterium]
MTEKTQSTINKVKVKKNCGWFFVFIALIFSIVAIGGTGYLYYIGYQIRNALNQNLNNLTVSIGVNHHKVTDTINRVTTQLDMLESQINNQNMNQKEYSLLQLNELISMANQSLVVYNDVKSALKLLNYAANIVNETTDAQYVSIKSAIVNDINDLGQLQYADAIVMTSKLNLMINQINTLPLLSEKDSLTMGNDVVNPQDITNSGSLWLRFWNSIKQDFKSLVTISSTNGNKAIQLLPEKEIIIRQNIKLYLLNLRIALLQHDDVAWKFNLNNINTDLALFFVKTHLLESVKNNVDDLIKVNISMNNANIDNTLKALNKLNSLQK